MDDEPFYISDPGDEQFHITDYMDYTDEE